MTFGEKVKKARLAMNLSQAELARLTGISEESLNTYEQLETLPRKNNIEKLAEALHISVSYLLDDVKIKNIGELEFVVFCIENIAIRLEKNAEKVYQALSEQSNILNSYIIPEYEILHTQSKDYIVDDIISLMKERGIELWFYIMAPIWKFQRRI